MVSTSHDFALHNLAFLPSWYHCIFKTWFLFSYPIWEQDPDRSPALWKHKLCGSDYYAPFSWRRHFCYISTLLGALSRYPVFCLLSASEFSKLLWLDDVLVFPPSWAFTFAFISTFLHCPTCSLAPLALCQSECWRWNFRTSK